MAAVVLTMMNTAACPGKNHWGTVVRIPAIRVDITCPVQLQRPISNTKNESADNNKGTDQHARMLR